MFESRQLILVRKYLLVSLLLSILPLIFAALLYDRYVALLVDNIITQRLEANVQSVSEKIQEFISLHSKRLNDLAHMPEVEALFIAEDSQELSDNLMDIIYWVVGSADVYSVHFLRANNELIRSVPGYDQALHRSYFVQLSDINNKQNNILGPYLPENSRPGWFGIQQAVYHEESLLGTIVLKLRLASVTELTSELYVKDFYEPIIYTNKQFYLTSTGTRAESGIHLTTSQNIIPGWELFLIKHEKSLEDPRVKLRYILLLIIAAVCASIIAVFIHMSERLGKLVINLTKGAQAIANGDFSVKISEDTPGELKELAQAFNQMSGQLESMINSRVDTERRGTLGKLAAGIAHEIRNPLTTLKTTIQTLNKAEKDNRKQELFSMVSEEINRIDRMVEEFLSYARPHPPTIEVINLHDFFQSLEALAIGTLSDANIELRIIADNSLCVQADAAQLRQVFMNLILNAIDAMPKGGHLTIHTTKIDDDVIITLSDNGIGMDANTLQQVKTPFFTTKNKGTGLGLSICNQLLTEVNGSLDIDSQPNNGTQITICLPQ